MKDDHSCEIPLLHLYIRGALSLFEHEGSHPQSTGKPLSVKSL